MGKASRRKSSAPGDGVNKAVAKRVAAAERRALETHAERVHDYDLPAADRLHHLLHGPSSVPGGEGRAEIQALSDVLQRRGWEVSSVDFHEIAWDAPIDDEARRLIHSDEDYGEAIASIETDVIYETPVFRLTLPHRDSAGDHELSFVRVDDLLPLLDMVEAAHVDDDPTPIIAAARGTVDPSTVDRGDLVSAGAIMHLATNTDA